MRNNIFREIPELFSIRGHDYSEFMHPVNAAESMQATWWQVGSALDKSMTKVGTEYLEVATKDECKKTNAEAISCCTGGR